MIDKNKKGFTLAEVLVVLVIIGVIAAMTIPTLMQNYQKHVYVARLKDTKAKLIVVLDQMMTKENVNNFISTKLVQCGILVRCDPNTAKEEAKKYFKVVSLEPFGDPYSSLHGLYSSYYHVGTNAPLALSLTNGVNIGFWYAWNYGPEPSSPVFILIDVNGHNKGPNKWGRDAFMYNITMDNKLIPYGYYEIEKGDKVCVKADKSFDDGTMCSALIEHDGWKMNY